MIDGIEEFTSFEITRSAILQSIPYVQLVEVKYKIVTDANLVSGSGGTRKDIEDWLGRLPLALSGPPLYTICRGAITTSTSVWWT